MNRAIFLDLGGTIIYDKGLEKFFQETLVEGKFYVIKPQHVVFLPSSLEALATLSKTNYKIIIVTNVPSISAGYCTEKEILSIREKITREAQNKKAKINGFYYCPHRDIDNCNCRKPKSGMFLQAIKEHYITLIGDSWMVGDKTSDIKAGKELGCKTALVKTGYAGRDEKFQIKADYEFNNLLKFAEFVLNQSKK